MAWFVRMLGSRPSSAGKTKTTVQDCKSRFPKQDPKRALEVTVDGITALEKRVILSGPHKKLLKVLKQQRRKYFNLINQEKDGNT